MGGGLGGMSLVSVVLLLHLFSYRGSQQSCVMCWLEAIVLAPSDAMVLVLAVSTKVRCWLLRKLYFVLANLHTSQLVQFCCHSSRLAHEWGGDGVL